MTVAFGYRNIITPDKVRNGLPVRAARGVPEMKTCNVVFIIMSPR